MSVCIGRTPRRAGRADRNHMGAPVELDCSRRGSSVAAFSSECTITVCAYSTSVRVCECVGCHLGRMYIIYRKFFGILRETRL